MGVYFLFLSRGILLFLHLTLVIDESIVNSSEEFVITKDVRMHVAKLILFFQLQKCKVLFHWSFFIKLICIGYSIGETPCLNLVICVRMLDFSSYTSLRSLTILISNVVLILMI